MIESALFSYLSANEPLSALVGTRIYPGRRPQSDELPCLTYRRMNGGYLHEIAGGAGLAQPRIQIDCWATSYETAKGIANAVREALQGYYGSWGSVVIDGITIENEVHLYEAPQSADDVAIHHIAIDAIIPHRVSVPEI